MAKWRKVSLYAFYGLGLLTLVLHIFTPQLFVTGTNDPLLVDNQSFRSIFSIYAVLFLLLSGLSLFNVIEAKRLSSSFIVKKQLKMLIAASLMTSLATILSIIGAIPGTHIPVFWVSSLLVVAVGFFRLRCYTLQRHSGNAPAADLTHSAHATGLRGCYTWACSSG
jgi:uncharacterized membrane protein